MNIVQLAWIAMARIVMSICSDFMNILSTNPRMSGSMGRMEDYLRGISENEVIQKMNLKGYTEEKQIRKTALIEIMRFVINRIISWATDTGETEILRIVNISDPKLLKMNSEDLNTTAVTIHEICVEHATALTDYGITNAVISDLNGKKNAFFEYNDIPGKMREARTKATEEIDRLQRLADDELKLRMDVYAKEFAESNPDFYGLYLHGRKETKPAKPIYALRGKVVESGTLKPIPEADIYLQEVDAHVTSSTLGYFRKLRLPNGPVHVTVTYRGYVPVETEVMIFPGQTAHLEILMNKEA